MVEVAIAVQDWVLVMMKLPPATNKPNDKMIFFMNDDFRDGNKQKMSQNYYVTIVENP